MIAVTGCGFSGPPSNGLTGAHDAPLATDDAPQSPDAPAIMNDARPVDGAAMPDVAMQPMPDAMADAAPMPDVPAQPTCYGHGMFMICVATPPTQNLDFSANTTIDTSMTGGKNCDFIVGTPAICVISRTAITIEDFVVVRAAGPNPIVFGATGAITITGTLDVSSATRGSTGPGGNMGMCNAPTVAGANAGGAGGGAGGSFTTNGGNGGSGHSGTVGGNHGAMIAPPTTLRAGCPGGAGGDGQAAGPSGGSSGSGGGALGLFAGGSITIASSGYVDASGAGGGAGLPAKAGGGGGGSGGMIVIDGMSLTVAGFLYANGGGGGGGAGASTAGSDGFETVPGHVVTETGGGPGGNDTPPGGNGAAGATRMNTAGNAANTTDTGAGGGGGAFGVVHVVSGQTISAANVSPAPT